MTQTPSYLDRFNKTEKAILILALLMLLFPVMAGLFNVQFVPWWLGPGDRLFHHQVGEFKRVNQDVRRRMVEDTSFLRTRTEDTVFMGDSVLTDENSMATLHLKDGSVIQVPPKTLLKVIVIEQLSFTGTKRAIQLNVDSGQVKVLKYGSNLQLKLDTGQVVRSEAELKVATQVTKVNEKETPEIVPDPVVPVSILDQSLASSLGWTEPVALVQLAPEVIPDATPVAATPPVQKQAEKSAKSFKLMHPKHKSTWVRVLKDGKEIPLLFTWAIDEECAQYEWQFSSDAVFENDLESRTLTENFVTFLEPRTGRFYWRVRCVLNSGAIINRPARELKL